MGILDKKANKSSFKSVFVTTGNSNMYKINGSKKESYSLGLGAEIENIDPKKKDTENLVDQDIIYHENPAFEPDTKIESTNPFEVDLFKQTEHKEIIQLTNQTIQNQTSNGSKTINCSSLLYIDSTDIKNFEQFKEDYEIISSNCQGLSSLTSISNTEKLAAAAAAAVSSTAASVVEIPNFGEELSSMMQQNRMDEIEIGSKNGDTSISQTHGFTFGEASNPAKMKKSPSSNAIGDLGMLDDDAKLKLTGSSSSYDIKIRQRRACHLKVLIILMAMLTAGFIGCIFTYYFMRYQVENQKYLSYTQNMVYERASKIGSNKLEVLVPFDTNVTDLNDKSVIVNKIEEIVLETFNQMNKTVEVMQLFELNEIKPNSYIATIDIELKDASDFSDVVLVKENERRIKIDDSSDILKDYREKFLNVTLGLNLNLNNLRINASEVQILYDFKMLSHNHTSSTLISTSTSSILKAISENISSQKTKFTHESKNLETNTIIVEINKSSISSTTTTTTATTTTTTTVTTTTETVTFTSKVSSTNLIQTTNAPTTTTESTTVITSTTHVPSSPIIDTTSVFIAPIESTEVEVIVSTTSTILPRMTVGVSRILSTTVHQEISEEKIENFEPKNIDKETDNFTNEDKSDTIEESNVKMLKNDIDVTKILTDETEILSSSTTVEAILSTTNSVLVEEKNKVLIADIILNDDDDDEGEKVKESKIVKTIEIEPLQEQLTSSVSDEVKLSTSIPVIEEQSKFHDGLDIVLQLDGNDSSLLNRVFQIVSRKK